MKEKGKHPRDLVIARQIVDRSKLTSLFRHELRGVDDDVTVRTFRKDFNRRFFIVADSDFSD